MKRRRRAHETLFREIHVGVSRRYFGPISDGNGRTGRMVMMYSLLQEGFPPLIIEKETKA